MTDPTSTQPRGVRARLGLYAVPVALLLAGYLASKYYFAGLENRETLERLPDPPALNVSTRALEPLLTRAQRAIRESATADNVGQLGKIYHANYFYDEAMACYARAMELDPGNAQWPYLLAYLRDMMGLARGDSALIDRAIELDPGYVPARLRRADNRYKAGDREGAKADYLRCLELDSSNAYARIGLGRIAADGEDWAAAEEHLRMALAGERQFGTTYRLLAAVYEKLGNEGEARKAQAAADALGPFEVGPDPWVDDLDQFCYHTDQLLTKANRAEKIDQYDAAQAFYRRVLEIEPVNFVANAKMGILLQGLHRYPEAAPFLEKAVQLPERSDIQHSQLNLFLGNNYFVRRAPELAAPFFQKAVELEPRLEPAHRGLAGCFLQLNRLRDAIYHSREALALNPESHESHFNLAQALLMSGDVEGAIPHFSAAREREPNFPPADFMVGSYYFSQGEKEQATPYLERALEVVRAEGNEALASQVQSMLGQ